MTATHVDPTGTSGVEQAAAGPKPWRERVPGAVLSGAFNSMAAVLIVVADAIYVGVCHTSWAKSLVSHTPIAEQADGAMSVAMATDTADAAAPMSTVAPVFMEAVTPPALPDRAAVARNRMEQRVYS